MSQWFLIDGTLNIADLGTRHAEVSEIAFNSEWQLGKPWMSFPRQDMPLRSVDEINLTSEEKRSASLETKDSIMFNELPELIPRVSDRYKFSLYLYDPNKRAWDSSVRVMSYVLRFLVCCKPGWSPLWFPPESPFTPMNSEYPFVQNGKPHLTESEVKRGENYFFYRDYKDSFIIKNEIYHYVGRILDSQEISSPEDTMFDLTPLSFVQPIVDRYSPVAYSIMLHCHETVSHHRSATASLLESRYLSYILRGRDLASEVVKACRFCVRHRCKLIEVEFGKLHPLPKRIQKNDVCLHCPRVIWVVEDSPSSQCGIVGTLGFLEGRIPRHKGKFTVWWVIFLPSLPPFPLNYGVCLRSGVLLVLRHPF